MGVDNPSAEGFSVWRFALWTSISPCRRKISLRPSNPATLAILSQGRFVLGVGAGWMREKFDIYGVEFESRGRRMDEMLEVLAGLFTGNYFEYHGEFFDFDPIVVSPKSDFKVPLYFGGAAPVALRRWLCAGRHAFVTAGSVQAIRPKKCPSYWGNSTRFAPKPGEQISLSTL